MRVWASSNPRQRTSVGAKTEPREALAKTIAAKCFAPEQAARLAPKAQGEMRPIKIAPLHVEEHVSKKTKTFRFSPSFLNCCARKSWVGAGNEIQQKS